MAGVVTASIVIDFDTATSDNEGILTAEVDAFPAGMNAGITTFAPGDSPGFLVYASSNVVIDSMVCSEGLIASYGGGITPEPIVDNLVFTDSKESGLTYPVYRSFTAKSLGNNFNPGNITHTETTVSIEDAGVNVIHVSYDSYFSKYRLTGIPQTLNGETSFPVVIYITGHVE